MDKRKRIIVVEDDESARNTYIMNLEKENYRVDWASNLSEAKNAVDKCFYHIALIDIMLAGREEYSNRDGDIILEYLGKLNEGTRAIVITTLDEGELVRNYLVDLKATDYISKDRILSEGLSILISKVNKIIAVDYTEEKIKWESLIKSVAFGYSESNFVSICLEKLKIKGGYENLSNSLVSACKYLMPLLIPKNIAHSLEFDQTTSTLRGKFWAKGQGIAVEIILCNKSINSDEIVPNSSNKLLESIKKGLKIIIYELHEYRREDFTYIS